MKTKMSENDDAVKQYYSQIKNIPLLSAEEEKSLSKLVLEGNQEAKNKLIESNLRLVVKVASAFIYSGVPFIDLIQDGNIGLIKAVERFDYARDVRFSTYAAWWIRQSIMRSLFTTKRTIRLPHRKEDFIKRIHITRNNLSQSMNIEITSADIASNLGVDKKSVEEAIEMSNIVISLETMTENSEAFSLLDLCADDTYRPDIEFENTCIRESTLSLLEALLDKERAVLLQRFGFFGKGQRTLRDIGDSMGISAEAVRQIEKRAMKKLRNQINEHEFVWA